MTALRTVGGDAAAAERAKVKAELVADAVAQLKAHIEADAPTQQALFGRLMSKALDDFADRTRAIRKGEFWRGALWGALLSAGLTLVAVAYVYERAGMWGATIERFEGANAELKQMEDAR